MDRQQELTVGTDFSALRESAVSTEFSALRTSVVHPVTVETENDELLAQRRAMLIKKKSQILSQKF